MEEKVGVTPVPQIQDQSVAVFKAVLQVRVSERIVKQSVAVGQIFLHC